MEKFENTSICEEESLTDRESRPLENIRIGSVIDVLSGTFSQTVIDKNITKVIENAHGEKSMTGQSSYAYNTSMNKGSLGYKGSYGISGVSRINAAVSAYVGNSNANENGSISVNYNVFQNGGVEYINFGNLNASDLLASLIKSTQNDALIALEAYNTANEFLKKNNIKSLSDIKKLSKEKKRELEDYVSDWAKKVNNFYKRQGTGIIVAVVWGGIGTVSTKITTSKSDNIWKYGGDATFNYSTLANSTTVAMTYDGSKESKSTDVEISCSSSYYGNCVKADTEEWYKTFANKSFAELSGVKPLESASFNVSTPKIPDFETPKAPEKITDKVKKIDNLEGLAVFAALSAFEDKKSKPGSETLALKQFVEDAQEPVDKEPLLTLENIVQSNEINPLDELDAVKNRSVIQKATSPSAQEANNNANDFQPLGAWIANWSDLFPWLAVGYDNNISNTEEAAILLKSRTFVQDLRALSILYQIAANGVYKGTTGKNGEAQQIANSYTSVLNNFIKETEYSQAAINQAFNMLSTTAQAIYKFWCKYPIFRSAELGFGVIFSSPEADMKYSTPPGRHCSTTFIRYYSSEVTSCELDPNRSCFANFIKVLPVFEVDNNENIIVKAMGPESKTIGDSMLFSSKVDPYICFGLGTRLQFTVSDEENNLYATNVYGQEIRLYPVPLSAATGGNWIGQSVSTPLSAFEDLREQFKDLNKQMEGMTKWSLSSKSWDKHWTGDTPYSPRTIETQYIGIVPEPGGIFGTKNSDSDE